MSAPDSIRLRIIDGGATGCDLAWLLLKPGRTLRGRADRERPAEWYPAASYTVLVETPRGRLLWDTGCPPDWEQRWAPTGLIDYFEFEPPEEPDVVRRLANAGVSADQLDYVVLSHLHFPHAGNARALVEAGASTLLCSDREKEFAFSFDGPLVGHHLKTDYEDLDLKTVSGDNELWPGVMLLEAPGHTPGQLCLRVDLPETGPMIFASDAIPVADAYGPPPLVGALVHDASAFHTSVEKIRSIAERDAATVVFGHDREQLDALLPAADGWFA